MLDYPTNKLEEEEWGGGTCSVWEKWERTGKKEGKPDKPSQTNSALSQFPGFSKKTLPAYPSGSSNPGINIPVPEGGISEGLAGVGWSSAGISSPLEW